MISTTRILAGLACVMAAGTALASNGFHTFAEGGSSAVFDITPDGMYAAGTFDGQAYRWSAGGGLELLSAPAWLWTHTAGISADGTQITSSVEYGAGSGIFGPARWTEGSGWEELGGLYDDPPYDGGGELSYGSGYDISGDGETVVGLAWHPTYRASGFSWTEAGGMVDLGNPPGSSSRASAISTDGSTIVGFYEDPSFGNRRPVRWADGGGPDLFLGEDTFGEATGTNTDGSIIVGAVGMPGDFMATAFIYSDTDGHTDLGILPGQDPDFNRSFANAVSDTGVVVGWSGDMGPWGVVEPFVWTEADGMMLAGDWLASYGVEIPAEYSILSVMAISADGQTIAGQAVNWDTFAYASFVATIPTPGTLALLSAGGLIATRRRR